MSSKNTDRSKDYDLLVFDLDGTLVDTLLDLSCAVNYTLGRFDLPFRAISEVRNFVGNGARKLMQRALGEDNERFLDEALGIMKDYYSRHACDQTATYPGVVGTLGALSDKILVVYTNKPQGASERILKDLELTPFFAAIYGQGSGMPLKPDPAGLLTMCERHGVPPERAAMIGDGDTDILAAKGAGVDAYAASYGFRGREALAPLEPTAFFDAFDELKTLLA